MVVVVEKGLRVSRETGMEKGNQRLKRNEWKDGEGRNPVNAEIGLNPGCFAAIQVNATPTRGSLSRKLIIEPPRSVKRGEK